MQPHGSGSSAWPWGGGCGLAVGLAQSHQCQQEPAMAVSAPRSPRLLLLRICRPAFKDCPACKCQCSSCVRVHQTGEAPGKEPQACYTFSCFVVSEISTAVPEPVSWGPQGAWDWVNLAKSLWGLKNWNNQKKGFFLVTCNITEQLTVPCYMFDCICNVLFAYYSDEFAGKAAQGTIIF